MKINKITNYKYKLLKLKLIKTKIYKKNSNNFIQIENIINKLKKALTIIYKYHINNKRILFVGSPIYIDPKLKNLIKNTKHRIIPESIWINGLITNKTTCFNYISKNQKVINSKVSEILFQMKKRGDLIVILDASLNRTVLEEGYLDKTPVISLGSTLEISDQKSSYKVPGNFKFTNKKTRDTFFYSILSAVFKKAHKELKAKIRLKKLFLNKKKHYKKRNRNQTFK